ncbi:helix-turn-helix domain-containing protein [Mesorhizobium sp. B2-4-10]|uniref:helix-turn-helix domain-containing protein n=1 Tax=Mesorhizobium sp. B2-4-10 TaxID=2589939 RepID=UPI00112B6432|nr:helix-turn-helix domain-containing protein [Mesorhizobium sp. B2-4-10]TPL16758.1 helix-turn-helix domain-containing protein [Mesorhizobium sp. B2-4-10]
MLTKFEARALAIPDFARWASIGRSKIYQEIQSGRLKARKIGGRTVIAIEDARDWFDANAKEVLARRPTELNQGKEP